MSATRLPAVDRELEREGVTAMQFYRDGFRGGDPDIRTAAWGRGERDPHAPLPEEVDVLIVGTGPAGLCLAAQLSQFTDIDTMIVERSPSNITKGKADGINTRTMEMFQAFGFAEKVKRESCWVNQTSFWAPNPDNPAEIRRVGRVQDVADDSSEMPHVLINQARVHELFLDVMRNSPTRLVPHYSWGFQDLTIDTSTDDHPVTVTLENAGVNAGDTSTVRANYVVGCDGARSLVRQAIGGELHGDAAHQAWGVMDILANTDFPDIRQKCLIQSASEGNILVLPREGGYLVRLYVELDKLNPDERVADRDLTIDHVISAANRILRPYTLDVKEVVWWSLYEIGHRLTNRFDDVPEGSADSRTPRVFTAGDACHTHSPKAGQGMNVSMQDTFNLGWKLAHVLQGRADARLLHSYSAERWTVAKRLIETDQEWARIMSAPPGESELDGSDEPRFIRQFKENLEFTGGLAVRYDESTLTGPPTHQALATGQEIGRRFHSAPVVRVADAKQMQLGHVADADGRWRIYIFGARSDGSVPGAAVHGLADWLMHDPDSPVVTHTRDDEDVDGLIDVRAVFQQTFDGLDYENMPALLIPRKGALGLTDHEKVFCVDHKGEGDIFTMRGIDRDRGCMIVVRPDQYVAHVLPLDARRELAAFFAAIYHPVPSGTSPSGQPPPDKPYLDIPGTTIFDADQARAGYSLNQFCMSLMSPENRERFKADERAYLDEWDMTEDQKQGVLDRDLNRLISLGGNIYFLAKIGATDGSSFQQMAGSMTGMSEDEYRLMMVSGGRSIEGNRYASEWDDANGPARPATTAEGSS
jgi:phenol 2-monooxygenase